MAEIRFSSKAHRDFFVEMMGKCRKNDTYHRAFFYVMGIAPETRANINRMFDFKNDWIMPEGMHGGWQTSGTVRVCQLAFNLWNGYSGERQGDEFTPNDLFCCEFAPYFMEGIKIRYPEYCRDITALHPLPDTIPHSVSGMGKVVKKNLDKRIVYRYTEHG